MTRQLLDTQASSSTTYMEPFPPAQFLTNDVIVSQWPITPGFKAFWGWTQHRCDRIRGREILQSSSSSSNAITALIGMLDIMITWVEEVPPQPQSNQRFGNLAFRTYSKVVEERLPPIIEAFPNIPPCLTAQILPLLINSSAFGHPTRLDYGTGHELAFIFSLWCCVASGWIESEEEQDELILRVFARYLDLMDLLQRTYKLEPAGSHGVWGLDDYCFFPYLFGSAQLLGSPVTPTQALQTATTASPPTTDFYTISLYRLTQFKSGASFSEHSPLLHQLSTFPDWKKPHAGLRKMFLGEVVGKRVVVQGLWIGGWCWGEKAPDEGRERKRLGVEEANRVWGGR